MADNTTEVEISTPEIVTEEIDLESTEPKKQEEAITKPEPVKKDKTEQTKAYSERLNLERERIRKEVETSYKPLIETAKRLGYEGTPEEIALQLRADNEGKSVSEIKSELADEEKKYLERKKNDPDFIKAEEARKELKAAQFQQLASTQYAEIKAAFPDIKAKNMIDLVNEMGKSFADLLDKDIDAVDAYELVIKRKPPVEAQEKPPTIGSTKSKGSVTSDTYFTREQVSNMSREEIKKNFKEIEKSEKLWK